MLVMTYGEKVESIFLSNTPTVLYLVARMTCVSIEKPWTPGVYRHSMEEQWTPGVYEHSKEEQWTPGVYEHSME